MIKRIQTNKGFYTITTRRANYTDIHFGKITSWGNRQSFNKGDCLRAKTYININLGNDKNYLPIEIDRFIERIENNK